MSSGADVSSTVTVATMLSGMIFAGYKTEGVAVMYREGISVEIAIVLLARYSLCMCIRALLPIWCDPPCPLIITPLVAAINGTSLTSSSALHLHYTECNEGCNEECNEFSLHSLPLHSSKSPLH